MKPRINLLLPKEKNITDKIVYFSFNYLRYILVITQLIVIGVFFYRFKIDQEIIDLKEELEQKQEIVNVSQPLIKLAEASNTKINIISNLLATQDNFSMSTQYVFSRLPEAMKLSSFKVDQKANKITFDGYTSDATVLRLFLNRLNREKRFRSIRLVHIKKITEFQLEFNFELKDFIITSQN